MREAEQCGWVRKTKRSSGLAERSSLAGRRLGRVGEAAELCGAAELLGVPLTISNSNVLGLDIHFVNSTGAQKVGEGLLIHPQ